MEQNMTVYQQQVMYRYILVAVATDALVLKHQAINSIHSVDIISIVLEQFHTEISSLWKLL